ncbi:MULTISPECIES: nitrilase-related carbon-nitrogen hydrolase [Rhizobium]|uniref:N-carbamoylputrescine amidase n=1 Tax=Rhizobium esperanzae TaxID=1967781 RepID=A0A7W6UKM9_9HYPH|nr:MULTISPECIES: nitrilase-related carbon-nitrogen hydrolase [Rhizobium]MBB4439968.1 N-carbamoylputrescine amidase [Rhizobium esperanzae]MDH6202465.1 putative amidohydrolase [Rhizobium leguminosarum]
MVKAWSVEWPEGLLPGDAAWEEITRQFVDAENDILITNEMPFGFWQPTRRPFDVHAAREWAALHERALDTLSRLPVAAVISSRPVFTGNRLVNEGFVLIEGRYDFLHQKHYFPSEAGWEEESWFELQRPGFDVVKVAGVKVGMLICTELMFVDKARHLGKAGADLIAVPRATGVDHRMWKTAASMAGIASGACIVSSNRVGSRPGSKLVFGGRGFTVDSDGFEVSTTSAEKPSIALEIDLTLTSAAKCRYPVYVKEPDPTDSIVPTFRTAS